MKKNVLVISQVIPQWYVDLLSQALGENVHIDIMTGSEVKGSVIQSPKHDARSFKSRLVCWWKHYCFAKQWAYRNREKKYDMIFAVSNPPINSYIGLLLKKRFKAPFVYMNWDLYPQVIEETIHNPVVKCICNVWNRWNSRNYPRIDRILTIGSVMADSMQRPLNQSVEITVLPIAVDTDYLKPISKDVNPFVMKYNLKDKFVILYSGKMGIGHNIELILEAAVKLQSIPQIQFVFIGEGPKYSTVERFIEEKRCQNILLLPLQPNDVFPYSMASADVGIVTQESKMAHLFMPSKTYSMMACGQAIIGVSTNKDDLYHLIQENEIGVSITEQDSTVLAEAIKCMFCEKKDLIKYQRNARTVAEEKFSLKVIKEKYRILFKELMENA